MITVAVSFNSFAGQTTEMSRSERKSRLSPVFSQMASLLKLRGVSFCFVSFRRIPGTRCMNDLTNKLPKEEDCGSTTPSPPSLHLRLLNKTSEAKIGDGLYFSVGVSGG